MGAAAVALGAFALALAGAASGLPPPVGNWAVAGAEAYADQVITLHNITDLSGNATEYGNLTVEAAGDLTFDNVTLVLPFRAALDIQGRAVFRNSTVVGERWSLRLRGDVVFTDDTFVNATDGGTAVETNTVVLERVLWNCSGAWGPITVRRAIDFRNQTLANGCSLAYDPPTITVNKAIDISNLTIRGTAGATGITFGTALHTGRVHFDLHDLSINGTGSGWGMYWWAASPSTSYAIHDLAISETGSAAIRADSFDGDMAIWNVTFTNVLRAFRMDGLPNGQVVATADNVTVVGTTDSILANDVTWVIRNSTIMGASPQFDAGANGHIRIYDSVDSAFAANSPGTGGSIEHFIWLDMSVPTWQGSIAIVDDLVTLLDANNVASVLVNASTWAPQEIVWWGMYPGPTRIDNRQLKPVVVDAGVTLGCTPASFLVSPGMATVDVTCNDDSPPTVSVLSPSFPRIQNQSSLSGTARVTEAGSGLNTVEFSLDGLLFGPVTFAPGDARNFSFSRPSVADGVYTITLRATDRTGNVRLVTAGPLTVDTVPPALAIDPLPSLFSGSSYTIQGTTEPNTSISAARAGGFRNNTTSAPSGAFAVAVQLEEGVNTYTVTARDAAGNTYSLTASTQVDTQAPALLVLLDGLPTAAALTASGTVRVEGSTEAAAQVRVNGILAPRAGETFALDLSLTRGRTDLTVVSTDVAGNRATWFGIAYFDDAAPSLVVQVNGAALATGSTLVTRSASAAVVGTASDAETSVASLIVNGKALLLDGTGGFATAVLLAEDDNTLTVTASDVVGNTASFSITVVRDSTPPTFDASISNDTSPVVYASGEALTAGATAVVVLVASENGTATIAGTAHAAHAGENRFVVGLVEGRNVFSVAFVDAAGNPAAPTTVVVERRTLAPPIALSGPAASATVEAATVEVAGSTDPQTTVKVNGQPVVVSPTGSFAVTVDLLPGENTLVVEATDVLGNTNQTTRTVTRVTTTPTTRATDGGVSALSLGLLAAGLAGGAAAGFFLGRRGAGGGGGRPDVTQPDDQARAPKGPRGPKPPDLD